MSRKEEIRNKLRERNAAWSGSQTGSEKNELAVKETVSAVKSLVSESKKKPVLDGPLPKEIREIIDSSCSANAVEEAEVYARRLLAAYRRVKVYREELNAAQDEQRDYENLKEKSFLVEKQLKMEIQEIDERIQQLVDERNIIADQLEQESENCKRLEQKEDEAKQRVESISEIADKIMLESQRGQMLLRQLVPNLKVENYIV